MLAQVSRVGPQGLSLSGGVQAEGVPGAAVAAVGRGEPAEAAGVAPGQPRKSEYKGVSQKATGRWLAKIKVTPVSHPGFRSSGNNLHMLGASSGHRTKGQYSVFVIQQAPCSAASGAGC